MHRSASALLLAVAVLLAGCAAPAVTEPAPEPQPADVTEAEGDATPPPPTFPPIPPKVDVESWWSDEGCGLAVDAANVTIVPGTRVTVNATFRNCSSAAVDVHRSACDDGFTARLERNDTTWALWKGEPSVHEGRQWCMALYVPPITVPPNGTLEQAFVWDGTFEATVHSRNLTTHYWERVAFDPGEYRMLVTVGYAASADGDATLELPVTVLPREDGLGVLSRTTPAAHWTFHVEPGTVVVDGDDAPATFTLRAEPFAEPAQWANLSLGAGATFSDGSTRAPLPPQGGTFIVRLDASVLGSRANLTLEGDPSRDAKNESGGVTWTVVGPDVTPPRS